MADKTDRRFTRDLMLEAVPCRNALDHKPSQRHPAKTYKFFSQHLRRPGDLILGRCKQMLLVLYSTELGMA